jgi:hypothetical protein
VIDIVRVLRDLAAALREAFFLLFFLLAGIGSLGTSESDLTHLQQACRMRYERSI